MLMHEHKQKQLMQEHDSGDSSESTAIYHEQASRNAASAQCKAKLFTCQKRYWWQQWEEVLTWAFHSRYVDDAGHFLSELAPLLKHANNKKENAINNAFLTPCRTTNLSTTSCRLAGSMPQERLTLPFYLAGCFIRLPWPIQKWVGDEN